MFSPCFLNDRHILCVHLLALLGHHYSVTEHRATELYSRGYFKCWAAVHTLGDNVTFSEWSQGQTNEAFHAHAQHLSWAAQPCRGIVGDSSRELVELTFDYWHGGFNPPGLWGNQNRKGMSKYFTFWNIILTFGSNKYNITCNH